MKLKKNAFCVLIPCILLYIVCCRYFPNIIIAKSRLSLGVLQTEPSTDPLRPFQLLFDGFHIKKKDAEAEFDRTFMKIHVSGRMFVILSVVEWIQAMWTQTHTSTPCYGWYS